MSVLVDLILMGLLIATIIHSLGVSKALQSFQKLHGEMGPALKEYYQALAKGREQIDQMKKLSVDIDKFIGNKVSAASTIKEDLDFLVSRANGLADQLERIIHVYRIQEFSHLNKVSKGAKNSLIKDPQPTEKDVIQPQERISSKSEENKREKKIIKNSFVESLLRIRSGKKGLQEENNIKSEPPLSKLSTEEEVNNAA